MMWNFKKFKNQIAAVDDEGNTISYGALQLFEKKLKIQCKRGLCVNLCTNSIGSLSGYAAMINVGLVPIMLSADMDHELCKELIQLYQPEYLWIPNNLRDEFGNSEVLLSDYNYLLLKTNYNYFNNLNDELALLLTTSGSTGSPKLVRQSYNNIKANTESIIEYLGINSEERPITTLPMNYTYGLSIINTHLYVGATILLTSQSMMQKGFWEFFKTQQATSFGGVPYTYAMLKRLHFINMDLPCLKTMTQAGGKLAVEVHKEFAQYAKDNHKKFVVMYGQTEATARMAYLPDEMALEKIGSMGIAIPGGCFSLIKEDGTEIKKSNETGELVYKGPNVTLGYAECREDLEKGDERQGILYTGDIAKCDDDGYYYIIGRKKRFIKIFGKRINLDEIDNLVKEKYEDLECASCGIDDKMYIFINSNTQINEIRTYISEKICINASAIKVKYIDSIPKNDAGKILYKKLENYYD